MFLFLKQSSKNPLEQQDRQEETWGLYSKLYVFLQIIKYQGIPDTFLTSVIKSMGKEHKSISDSENKLSRLQELVHHYLQCILDRRVVFVTHNFMSF